MAVGEIERTGIVEEGRRRREVFGRFIDRSIEQMLTSKGARREIDRAVAARVSAEIEAALQRRVEAQKLEMSHLLASGPTVPLRALFAVVGNVTGRKPLDLISPRRARSVAWPRHFAMWLVREMRPDLSLTAIGKVFNRDHTTCIYGIRNVEENRTSQPFKGWLKHPEVVALMTPKEEAK